MAKLEVRTFELKCIIGRMLWRIPWTIVITILILGNLLYKILKYIFCITINTQANLINLHANSLTFGMSSRKC